MTMNIFEKGLKQHVRFNTTRGAMAIEDLLFIPLDKNTGFNLDAIALDLYNEINRSETHKSFIKGNDNAANTLAQLKFDIVQQIIDDKVDNLKKAELRKLRKDKRSQLADLITEAKNDKLKKTPLSKLEAMLDDLDDDLEDE